MALKASQPLFDNQTHIIFEKEGASMQTLYDFMAIVKTKAHLNYVITHTDIFDIDIKQNLAVLNTQFNFHSLNTLACVHPKSIADVFKP